jgi:hypothetical protein
MKQLKSTHAKIFYFEIAIDTVFGSFAAVATFFVPPNGATSVEISRSLIPCRIRLPRPATRDRYRGRKKSRHPKFGILRETDSFLFGLEFENRRTRLERFLTPIVGAARSLDDDFSERCRL